MTGRRLVALLVVFSATRIVLGCLADNGDRYAPSSWYQYDVDVVYRDVANRVLAGERPYADFDLEYPPGVLPAITAPLHQWPLVDGYRAKFIILMIMIDAAGLAALVLIARRKEAPAAPWAWTLLLPLLGPVTYVRLDLIPAVATIWALERYSAGRSSTAGAWLGFGFLAKVYPLLLLPLMWRASTRAWRVLAGFCAAVVAILALSFALYGASPMAIFSNVWSYHSSRGIHIESTWGSLLLLGRGTAPFFGFSSGAYHFQDGLAAVLHYPSFALSGLAVLVGFAATRRGGAEHEDGIGAVAFATLTLVLAFGTVFSPQFLIWVIALAAVAMATPSKPIRGPILFLGPTVALTQVIFPLRYLNILEGDLLGRTIVVIRNLIMLTIGVWALVSICRTDPDLPLSRGVARARNWVSRIIGPSTRTGLPDETPTSSVGQLLTLIVGVALILASTATVITVLLRL